IGDSDSGFIGSADGVLDIYCNNAKVGYIDNAGLHMLADVSTDRNIVLRGDDRKHIIIQNADGSVRGYIYKDKEDTGIHINNGADGYGDFLFGKNSEFYSPAALHAGGSTVAIDGNIWGTRWNASGQWLWDAINQNFIARVRRGSPVNPGKVNEYGPAEAPTGCVVTSVRHDPTTAYGIYFTYRPLSVFINGGWRVIEG
ncbi:phage tail protein, partial [Salmonella enterica]|nr:phage tail protein [Salmonella enterica]